MNFKQRLKNSIRLLYGKQINELHLPERINVVSFDLFDTLIYRTCGNDNLFDEMRDFIKSHSVSELLEIVHDAVEQEEEDQEEQQRYQHAHHRSKGESVRNGFGRLFGIVPYVHRSL